MHGTRGVKHKAGKTYEYFRYLCSTYKSHGRSQCNYNPMHQESLVKVVVAKIREAVIAGGHHGALRSRVVERLKARQTNERMHRDRATIAAMCRATGLSRPTVYSVLESAD